MKNAPRMRQNKAPKKNSVKFEEDEVHEMPKINFSDAEEEDEDMEKLPKVSRCPIPEVTELQKEVLDSLDYVNIIKNLTLFIINVFTFRTNQKRPKQASLKCTRKDGLESGITGRSNQKNMNKDTLLTIFNSLNL